MKSMQRDPQRIEGRTAGLCDDHGSERGAALLMVLILTATSLAFTAGLIYLVTSGAQTTGGQRRFETALESGRGGIVVARRVVEARGNPGFSASLLSLPAQDVSGFDCLADKLNNPTASWNGSCDNTLPIIPGTPTSYDMIFNLATERVYAKVVDTVEGNSGPSSGLLTTGVVQANSGEINVVQQPYLYTVEILSEDANNPQERARMSALLQY